MSDAVLDKIQKLLDAAKQDEEMSSFINGLLAESASKQPWVPLPGPQTDAYYSEADIIGYGGAAGGGKTDLACGKAITQHKQVAILRREATQLGGIYERLTEIIGSREGFNGQSKEWHVPIGSKPTIVFGSTPNPGDETKHQGRSKDLLVLDEAANFLESQARFLMGWVRTTDPNQKAQVLLTFNPPTNADGQWIRDFFGPWLDRKHPDYPTRPGTLLWYVTLDGVDYKVDGKIEVKPGEKIPGTDKVNNEEYPLMARSRTFIPAKIKDNPFLMKTGYVATLQAMPEPLRSQMLKGDFSAGLEDDPWQVIPTKWIEEAMDRWKPRDKKGEMTSMGVDVSRGLRDKSVIARRHGMWYDELIRLDGTATIDGPSLAGQIISYRRNAAPVHIDIIGVGSSPYDALNQNDVHVIGVNVAEKSYALDNATGKLKFFNKRAELWWRLREALDPINDTGIALPPDPKLLADLSTPLWEYRSGGVIKIESKEEIIKRLGRSPDDGDAVVLALVDTPKRRADMLGSEAGFVTKGRDFDPFDVSE